MMNTPSSSSMPWLGRWLGWPAVALSCFAVASTAAAVQARHLQRATRQGRLIAQQARAFVHDPPTVHARVLLLGDSTGVGVGAGRPEDSLPGLLAGEFPCVQVINRCVNGARVGDLLRQLPPADDAANDRPYDRPYDLVLVLAGGNDVLKATPRRRLARQAHELLDALAPRARRIVWLGSANIGSAPVLRAPLSWWFSGATGRTMRLLGEIARGHGAEFIDFWQPRRTDPFGRDAATYFAADGVHPSAASYRRCFDELKQRVRLAPLLIPRTETQEP